MHLQSTAGDPAGTIKNTIKVKLFSGKFFNLNKGIRQVYFICKMENFNTGCYQNVVKRKFPVKLKANI